MTSPAEYPTGAVKQHPDTKAVAVRTDLIEADGSKDWGVMTVDRGGRYASWEEVQNWVDMERTG